MEKHTAQVSCKLCGENMQACDLPAHKTDACSLTQICCQYCELMLERRNMADHEMYCGTRTEKCTECSELVMFKYKKLHEDSNHSFLKLDDEPGPVPSWKVKQEKTKKKPAFNSEAAQNIFPEERTNNVYQEKCKIANSLNDNVKNFKSANKPKVCKENLPFASTPPFHNAQPNARTDQNSGINMQLPSTSRGAIKKRIAPLPPDQAANKNQNLDNVAVLKPFTHIRDVPMYHAMSREQEQIKKREEQNRFNAENGLPPILTTADKVEKLRKMSDLQNFDYDEYSKKNEQNKLQKSKENKHNESKTHNGYHQPQNASGCSTSKNVNVKTDKNNRKKFEYLEYSEEAGKFISPDFSLNDNVNEIAVQTSRVSFMPPTENHHNMLKSPKRNVDNERTDNNISKDNPNNFQNRKVKKSKKPQSNDNVEMLVDLENASNYNTPNSIDRFSDIKNSLTALRKEFKNCTSPYETKNLTAKKEDKVFTKAISPKNDNIDRDDDYNPIDLYRMSNDIPDDLIDVHDINHGLEDVMLPCEFCEEMIQASELVVHETGCRPSITSFSENNELKKKSKLFVPPNTPDGYAPKIPNANTNVVQNNTAKAPAKSNSHGSKKGKNNKNVSTLLQNNDEVEAVGEADEVKLPCEFCMVLVPACRLQWHQRNCFAEISTM